MLDLRGRCERSGPSGYATVLAALHGIHEALEERLDRAMVDNPPIRDWEQRRGKPAWIAADLRQIAAAPPGCLLGRPRAESLPALLDPLAVLGCLYVVEGSMLGGRAAAQQVKSVLGDNAPTRFFAGYGSSTGAMWRSLGVALNRSAVREPGLGGLVTAARLTFEGFERHFADVLSRAPR
jgi:heme oxygenase